MDRDFVKQKLNEKPRISQREFAKLFFPDGCGFNYHKFNNWLRGVRRLQATEADLIREGFKRLGKADGPLSVQPADRATSRGLLFLYIKELILWAYEFGRQDQTSSTISEDQADFLAHQFIQVFDATDDKYSAEDIREAMNKAGGAIVDINEYRAAIPTRKSK